MATKLGLYQGTLLLIKERAISVTLSDTEAWRHTIDVVYDRVLKYMLEQGRWNFATRTVQLDASEDVEPEFGFSYAFDKPDDYRRTIKMSANERLFPTLGAGQFVNEGATWFADVDPLYVSYVSDGAAYGGDLTLWPEMFATAVEHEIAKRVGPGLTGISGSALDEIKRDALGALRRAKSWDAQNQPADPLPPGRLVSARRGYRQTARFRGE